ncbi:MAG TPA: hypothetical protein VK961_25140 [Chthoniobacter sp.]|nr:hypothetical protein [Chthoniobacter sp.]
MKSLLRLAVCSLSLISSLTVFAEDATPAGGNITDLKQILAETPHNVINALRNGATRDNAATQASDLLRTKVQGRQAALTFKIDLIEKETRGQNDTGYRARAEEKHVSEVGTNLITYLWVHFDVSENTKASALKKGGEITATGKITQASISSKPTPALHVDLSDAKLK